MPIRKPTFRFKKREGDFPKHVKQAAFARQAGVCAFCGVPLSVSRRIAMSAKDGYPGEAHHLRPLFTEEEAQRTALATVANCVYLCYAHHKLLGHGMAPFGIDKQGGSSRHWVDLPKAAFQFLYWGKKKRKRR